MSLRINNNVAALNGYRNLSATNVQLGKSLEKLSSGFRINRAADDAAGLVKSESLRAEINGTKGAIKNAQDGVSFVQTAEGALNEVHSILQRMRELAVDAANTATTDGAAQQDEMTELLAELDAEIEDETARVQQGAKLHEVIAALKAQGHENFAFVEELNLTCGPLPRLDSGLDGALGEMVVSGAGGDRRGRRGRAG
mgnify:CR=1 FL=1